MYCQLSNLHQLISQNDLGKDYFVGDVHGHFSKLTTKLAALKFNKNTDRLFCVGDIIDRGAESEQCLELLEQEWFFSVLGNHEYMFLRCLDEPEQWPLFYSVGGLWAKKWQLDSNKLKYWAELILNKMPLSMTIKSNVGDIGLSHADAPTLWKNTQVDELNEELLTTLLWNRPNFKDKRVPKIEGAFCTVHGHTSSKKPMFINNQCWLDTIKLGEQLTVFDVATIDKKINSRWFR